MAAILAFDLGLSSHPFHPGSFPIQPYVTIFIKFLIIDNQMNIF